MKIIQLPSGGVSLTTVWTEFSSFIYNIDHWPCLWPWAWFSMVKSWNFHIFQIFDIIVKNFKEREFFEWFDILLLIFDLHFALIICCSAAQVWRFYRWQHKYDHIPVTTEMMCILGIIHAWELFWVSLCIRNDCIWNLHNAMSQGHEYCVNYDQIYYTCLK